jgi:transposase
MRRNRAGESLGTMTVNSWRTQHYLASAPWQIWQMEQRMEAVLAAQPLGGIRGILPGAGGMQSDRTLGPVLRQHDSTCPRLGGWGKRGQHRQSFGRSRGGFSTKIHLKTDLDGNPLDFHLTGGEASDSTQFETSLDIGPDIRPRIAMTDKGYDSQANRTAALARGITPVIPRRENSKQKERFFPKRLYKLRARIEQTIGKLKRFKRVAMRCEKTDTSYLAIVSFACGLMLVKSVHTA